MFREILYSPGYGAGWSSWTSDRKIKIFLLTSKVLIDFLKNNGNPKELLGYGYEPAREHLTMKQFFQEAEDRGIDISEVCLGGLEDLSIAKVSGDFRIDEYDGSERVVEVGRDTDIIRIEELD